VRGKVTFEAKRSAPASSFLGVREQEAAFDQDRRRRLVHAQGRAARQVHDRVSADKDGKVVLPPEFGRSQTSALSFPRLTRRADARPGAARRRTPDVKDKIDVKDKTESRTRPSEKKKGGRQGEGRGQDKLPKVDLKDKGPTRERARRRKKRRRAPKRAR